MSSAAFWISQGSQDSVQSDEAHSTVEVQQPENVRIFYLAADFGLRTWAWDSNEFDQTASRKFRSGFLG